jgi:hypothetical protein
LRRTRGSKRSFRPENFPKKRSCTWDQDLHSSPHVARGVARPGNSRQRKHQLIGGRPGNSPSIEPGTAQKGVPVPCTYCQPRSTHLSETPFKEGLEIVADGHAEVSLSACSYCNEVALYYRVDIYDDSWKFWCPIDESERQRLLAPDNDELHAIGTAISIIRGRTGGHLCLRDLLWRLRESSKLLVGGGPIGKVQLSSPFPHVAGNKPRDGGHLAVPEPDGLVRMTVIAGPSQDGLDLGRG